MDVERGALWRTLTGLAVAIWGCLIVAGVGIGALFLFYDGLPLPQPVVTSAASSTPTREHPTSTPEPEIRRTATPPTKPTDSRTGAIRATSTATSAPTRGPTVGQTQTRAHTPTQGATRTPGATHTPSATRTPTSSPTPTSTQRPTRTPTPTPIVCDDLDELSQLTIVPGQQFACSIGQDALTERVSEQPDVPCKDVTITMADGEIRVTCRIGVRLNAVGVVAVEDCRMSIQVVRGTIGFTQVVQSLLDANAQLIPYETICIAQAAVTDGQIEIEGHGR